MKKILFPITNSIHYARQQLLLEKLRKHFEVHLVIYNQKQLKMTDIAVDITSKFKQAIDTIKPDLVLVRGDRFELLPVAMLSAYGGYKVAQIEAGDLSGMIDNKVRYAISHLSDIHFATNGEAEKRLRDMGFKNVYNVGSLDVEYTLKCTQDAETALGEAKSAEMSKYLLCLYHPIPGENKEEVYKAINSFPYKVIGIRSNRDHEEGLYKDEYSPEEFTGLLKNASCLVGNSSAGIKEAGILGVPVVNIGSRQANRLRTKNIKDANCNEEDIKQAIKIQFKHGNYERDDAYYKENTSKNINMILLSIMRQK